MSITNIKYDVYNGKDVTLYTLSNENGLSVSILTLGGIVKNLVYRGRDLVLGYDTPEEYLSGDGYFGALIGRNANRIRAGEFVLNGKKYTLAKNNDGNNLHGGRIGFDKKVWDAEPIDGAEPSIRLSYVSPDGEEGFPGEVKVSVTYTVTKDNSLKIHYEAKSDRDTLFNMTNHSYFNLNGHSSGDIFGHSVWIDADFYNPASDKCLPTGEVALVEGTPYDCREAGQFGVKIQSDHSQMKLLGGFDNNFILNGEGYRLVASAIGDESKIEMRVYTDQAAMQLYTANQITPATKGKDGALYFPYAAFCFETQGFPASINYKHFPQSILKKDEKYESVTVYQFL